MEILELCIENKEQKAFILECIEDALGAEGITKGIDYDIIQRK